MILGAQGPPRGAGRAATVACSGPGSPPPVSLLDKLSESFFGPAGRGGERAFVDAAMAASALVATADGEVSFAERSRLDDLLTKVEPLASFDVHEAADLFRVYAETIRADPADGRAQALKAVRPFRGDPDAARRLLRIACVMGRAGGAYSQPGMSEIRRLAETLGQNDPSAGDPGGGDLDLDEIVPGVPGVPGAGAAAPRQERRPTVVTVGNFKGGTGKSTTAVHLAVGLMVRGHRVGCIDLDGRQATLSHYLANRRATREAGRGDLPMPRLARVEPAAARDREAAEAEERARLEAGFAALADCDFVILDTPGSEGHLSALGHGRADTLITPLNDSFFDIDALARIDRRRRAVLGPSRYAEMVAAQNERRVAGGRAPLDWLVMRNRLSQLDARNTRDMAGLLDQLAERMGFRLQPGLSERVVYRELFFSGLTLLDLPAGEDEARANPSRRNARQEIQDLLDVVALGRAAGAARFAAAR